MVEKMLLTTHEVTADYSVTAADAAGERAAAPRWFRLPDGWTWDRVASHRMVWGQPSEHFPIATAFGVAVWGLPRRPLRERVTLPYDARREFFDQLATARAARRLPGGAMAARAAADRARFIRLNCDLRRSWGV